MHQFDGDNRRITVVVCTFNREEMLNLCLKSLIRQVVPLGSFDIMVVDNNSSDGTRGLVAEFVDLLPNIKYVFEQNQGLAYARNRALTEAATEWVVYLDDDAIVQPEWMQTIEGVIDMDVFDAFGGVYLPWHYFRERPNWFDDRWATNKHVQGNFGPLNENAYISGGNCAIRRVDALACGGFPVQVGMSGGRISYGEETFLFSRMREIGCRLGFVPEMLIEHCVMPYKYTVGWHVKAAFAAGRDHQGMHRGVGLMREFRGVAASLVHSFFHALSKLLGNVLCLNPRPWGLVGINSAKEVAYSVGAFLSLFTRDDSASR